MLRFLVFTTQPYYPHGGVLDLAGTFDKWVEVLNWFGEYRKDTTVNSESICDIQVFDHETGMLFTSSRDRKTGEWPDLDRQDLGLHNDMIEIEAPAFYTHHRRGSLYHEVLHGRLQMDGPNDMAELVAYRDSVTGEVWFRKVDEFHDGRFIDVSKITGDADTVGTMLNGLLRDVTESMVAQIMAPMVEKLKTIMNADNNGLRWVEKAIDYFFLDTEIGIYTRIESNHGFRVCFLKKNDGPHDYSQAKPISDKDLNRTDADALVVQHYMENAQ